MALFQFKVKYWLNYKGLNFTNDQNVQEGLDYIAEREK